MANKICKVCRKEFARKPRRNIASWNNAQYCSKQCHGIANRGIKRPQIGKKISLARKGKPVPWATGENNYRWQGGKYTEDYRERRKFRFQMQKTIFERDNYTCQFCGSKKDLQVDHIQSWAEYIELRFSIDNCRTLCAKCHYKITFGREMPENIKGWGHNFLRRVEK